MSQGWEGPVDGIRHWKQTLQGLRESQSIRSPVERAAILLAALSYLATLEALYKLLSGKHPFLNSRSDESQLRRLRDFYELAWFAISWGLVFAVTEFWFAVAVILIGWRVFDICQKNARIVVFDRKISESLGKKWDFQSVERRLVLAILNYVELIVLYASLYTILPFGTGERGLSRFDSLYFSSVTFTTLGYGDIRPVSITKAVASLEAMTGMLYAVMLIGYLVALLRRPGHLRPE